MFRLLLTATFGAVLALALFCAGFAWWGATVAATQVQRARLAQAELAEYLRLQVSVDGLLRAVVQGTTPAQAGSLDLATPRQVLRDHFTQLRALCAAQVALSPDDEAEKAELETIVQLEQLADAGVAQLEGALALARAGELALAHDIAHHLAADGFGERFRGLLAAATRREWAAAQAASDAAGRLMAQVASHSRLGGVAAVIASIFSVVWLIRRFLRPLRSLADTAAAAAAGDMSRRVEPLSEGDEFGRVGQSVNAMLDEVVRVRGELERNRAELEQAVAARTAELAAANATLRRSDEARRRFLADISHELRTPITVMRGEAEIALRGQDKAPSEYRLALRRIAEEAGHTARLVDDLLFVARSESGEARVSMQPVSLDEVMERAIASARSLAEPTGVRLAETGRQAAAVVQGDPDRLRQLLLVLFDNAVRYSPPGGVVEVALTPTSTGVEIIVSDRGMGISPDEVERVFERFYRGDGAAARHGGGSGLGLPLARAIARAHGGEVTLEGRPGGGTTARLRLPLVRRLQAVA